MTSFWCLYDWADFIPSSVFLVNFKIANNDFNVCIDSSDAVARDALGKNFFLKVAVS